MTITRSGERSADDPRDDGKGGDDPIVRAVDEIGEVVVREPAERRLPTEGDGQSRHLTRAI